MKKINYMIRKRSYETPKIEIVNLNVTLLQAASWPSSESGPPTVTPEVDESEDGLDGD